MVENIFLVLPLFVALSQIATAQAGGGTVCVAARAATPFRGQEIPPAGEVSSGGLRVKVDQRPTVPWPQRKSLKIEALDHNERHLLAVIDAGGRSVESVWFRLSEYKSTTLRMAYDGYQGIGVVQSTLPWGQLSKTSRYRSVACR